MATKTRSRNGRAAKTAKAAKSEEVVLHELYFFKEKETKNTVRFQERVASDGEAIIGSLYIQKSAQPPDRLKIVISMP